MLGMKGKLKLVTLLLTAGIIVGGFLTTCDNALYDGTTATKTGAVQQQQQPPGVDVWEPTLFVLTTTSEGYTAILSFVAGEVAEATAFSNGSYAYRLHVEGEIFSKGSVSVTVTEDGTTLTFTSDGGNTFLAAITGSIFDFITASIPSDGEDVDTLTFQAAPIVTEDETAIPATSISLTYNNIVIEDPLTLTIEAGDRTPTAELAAEISGPEGADTQVYWLSSDSRVARIAQDGTLTALKGGEATITGKALIGGASAEATVKVEYGDSMPVIYLKRGAASETGVLLEGEGSLLVKAISYLNTSEDVQSGDKYRIELKDSAGVSDATSTGFTISKNIEVTLKATSAAAGTITKTAAGALFTVAPTGSMTPGPHLILDSNIKLVGYESNTNALVVVGNSTAANKGNLTMKMGSRITGNTNSGSGGGVVVSTSGTFIMEGGSIDNNKATGNTAQSGGVHNNGIFTMTGGEINNNVVGNSTEATSPKGGGVASSGTFTMSGGSITDNDSLDKNTGSTTNSYGGGVYVSAGTFTMSGTAVIANNSAKRGGGVLITGTNAKFYMEGGVIKGNVAKQGFSPSYPGIGAGVAVYTSGLFEKTGGTIYGLTGENANTGTDDSTCSMQKNSAANTVVFKRNETAGSDVNLTSDNNTLGNWE